MVMLTTYSCDYGRHDDRRHRMDNTQLITGKINTPLYGFDFTSFSVHVIVSFVTSTHIPQPQSLLPTPTSSMQLL